MFTYKPDQYTCGIGLPGTEFYVEIKNWISIRSKQTGAGPMFQLTKGILGEAFLDMSTDSSRIYDLSILQTSPSVEQLRNLFLAQRIGVVGFPFSIIDNSYDSNFLDSKHQKTFYPVAWIVDEPDEPIELKGTAWVFQIQCVSGLTAYF
ncbi:hypothetical protein KKI24_14350 [bacterium]|nr:hypothetical protein [bacterium]